GLGSHSVLDLVDAPRRPIMYWGIHVTDRPFIRRQLTIRVHVPLAKEKSQLFFGEVRINLRQRNAMKRKIPRGVPGVFPLVGHGDNVRVVEIEPFLIPALLARFWRTWPGRITVEPGANIVGTKLLPP